MSIGKVLIANRGEIAVRVARTCREMGIRTVAVYSDADRAALHVRCCDEAVRVGPAASRESYLVIDSVIAACKATRADAVHPGYGFLSENAAFARACASAGILFIGPPPEAIEEMGEKTRARRKVIEAGVPVVPGLKEPIPEGGEAKAKDYALSIGYPIMLKAAAGGGGKGMRLVAGPKDFDSALATAQREALSAFGDARVYIEKAVARPRHVEIQVFADTHGNCIWLGERECSVQRRHQKVIEETPSPVLTPELRAEMGRVAVNAAKAVKYVGAGTCEFLVDGNTRTSPSGAPGSIWCAGRSRSPPVAACPGRSRTCSRTSAATPSRRACTPRTRPGTSFPAPAPSSSCGSPRGPAYATTAASRAGAKCRGTTIR